MASDWQDTQLSMAFQTLKIAGRAVDNLFDGAEIGAWAWKMIEQDKATPSLCLVAQEANVMTLSELADCTKRALEDVGVAMPLSKDVGRLAWRYAMVQMAMGSQEQLEQAVHVVGDFEWGDGRMYILHCALDDLDYGMEWSTHDMDVTSANRQIIVRERCEEWVKEKRDIVAPVLAQIEEALS